ncbi:putative oxidoreductase SadH [Variibacter gotjawalensis]|uniref:Putative oxidoreductase SadH n=1 Tax=Variibacter gotjawalensis TaxID=1333996 RepID=A0A0S3PQQ5_9BRAD|nr:SDR family oxidoreductase [Variibacter gotjawalensis]NIK48504.1 short-subunit dehydrogenase [Variibacter gotjawalensis]RZS50369.1 short-subunit dehydrogenase [Variibacter gotjawalensis]BAT58204.1 putative oxidoreductase SadH [Variibacter gotjawalensis]
MNLNDKTAVITGAASGIGQATAVSLARRGCHVALVDINADKLDETERMIASNRVRVSQHRLDVADRDAVAAFPAEVLKAHPGVDVLMNNAGVALGGSFEQTREEDFDWLFEINFSGVVRMTRAFMPELRKSNEARIVNVSSIYGIIAPPGQTAYSAAKFAVRGFSNALREELAGSTIGVSVVHPGGIATQIAEQARMSDLISAEEAAVRKERARKMLKMPPAEAGEIIAKGIERNAERILVGTDAKVLSLIERLMPVRNWKLINRLLSR